MAQGDTDMLMIDAANEITRLRDENAALREDAARYRFLRAENAKLHDEHIRETLFVGWDNENGGDWVGCDLDAAIDAAMQKGE